jgi:hypothetical protein
MVVTILIQNSLISTKRLVKISIGTNSCYAFVTYTALLELCIPTKTIIRGQEIGSRNILRVDPVEKFTIYNIFRMAERVSFEIVGKN